MVKIIRYVLIAIGCVALLLPFFNVDKDVDIKELSKIADKYANKETMNKVDIKKIKSLYAIKESEIDGYYSYQPDSYMDVDEITIFKQDDETLRENLLTKVNTHIESEIKVFQGYAPNQTALLKKAKVFTKGDYVICIVMKDGSKPSNEMKDCF